MSIKVQYYKYDGDVPEAITKAQVKGWVKRVREDLRDFESALADGDLEWLKNYADDAVGAAAELQGIAEATIAVAEAQEH